MALFEYAYNKNIEVGKLLEVPSVEELEYLSDRECNNTFASNLTYMFEIFSNYSHCDRDGN